MADYNDGLPGNIRESTEAIHCKSNAIVRKCAEYLLGEKRGKRRNLQSPFSNNELYKYNRADIARRLYDGEITIKINGAGALYPKLTTFELNGTRYRIRINWAKVSFITKQFGYGGNSIR